MNGVGSGALLFIADGVRPQDMQLFVKTSGLEGDSLVRDSVRPFSRFSTIGRPQAHADHS